MKINALFSKSPNSETDSFFNLHHVPNACTASDSSEKKKYSRYFIRDYDPAQQLFKNLSGLVKKKNNCFSEVAKISTVNVTPP